MSGLSPCGTATSEDPRDYTLTIPTPFGIAVQLPSTCVDKHSLTTQAAGTSSSRTFNEI